MILKNQSQSINENENIIRTYLIINNFSSLNSKDFSEVEYDIFKFQIYPNFNEVKLKVIVTCNIDRNFLVNYTFFIKKDKSIRKIKESPISLTSVINYFWLNINKQDVKNLLSNENLILCIKLKYSLDTRKNASQAQRDISKSQIVPFQGIINVSSKCFVNTSLQLLFHISPIRKLVYKLPRTNPFLQLQNTFCWLQSCSLPANIKYFIQAISKDKLDSDFSTFFQFLLNLFEEQEEDIRQLYEFALKKDGEIIKSSIFELGVYNYSSLNDFFDNFSLKEKFVHLPKLFFIHTDRIIFQDNSSKKLTKTFQFPSQINMKRYVEAKINNSENIDNNNPDNINANNSNKSNKDTNNENNINNLINNYNSNNNDSNNNNNNENNNTNDNESVNNDNNQNINIDLENNEINSTDNNILCNRSKSCIYLSKSPSARGINNNLSTNNLFQIGSNSEYIYSLYAVVCHNGCPSSGHYTVYIQCAPNRWFLFNDSKVTFASENEAIKERFSGNNSPVLLVYVKTSFKPEVETARVVNSNFIKKFNDDEFTEEIKQEYLKTKEKIEKEEMEKDSLTFKYFTPSDLDTQCDRALKIRPQRSISQFSLPRQKTIQDLFLTVAAKCHRPIGTFRIWSCDEDRLIPQAIVRTAWLKLNVSTLLHKTLFIEELDSAAKVTHKEKAEDDKNAANDTKADNDKKVENDKEIDSDKKVENDKKADNDKEADNNKKVDNDKEADNNKKVDNDKEADSVKKVENDKKADKNKELDNDKIVDNGKEVENDKKVDSDKKVDIDKKVANNEINYGGKIEDIKKIEDISNETIMLIIKFFDKKSVQLVTLMCVNINEPVSDLLPTVRQRSNLNDEDQLIAFAEKDNTFVKLKMGLPLKLQGVTMTGTVLVFQKKSTSRQLLDEKVTNEFDSSSFYEKQKRNTVKNYIDRKYNMTHLGLTFNKQSKTLSFPRSMSLPDLTKFITHSFDIKYNENGDKLLFFNDANLCQYEAKNVDDLCNNSFSYLITLDHLDQLLKPIVVLIYEDNFFKDNLIIHMKINPTKKEIIDDLISKDLLKDDEKDSVKIYNIDFGVVLTEIKDDDILEDRFHQIIVRKIKNVNDERSINIKFVDDHNHFLKSVFFFTIIKGEIFKNTISRMNGFIDQIDQFKFYMKINNQEKFLRENFEVFSMMKSNNDYILAIKEK